MKHWHSRFANHYKEVMTGDILLDDYDWDYFDYEMNEIMPWINEKIWINPRMLPWLDTREKKEIYYESRGLLPEALTYEPMF